MAFDGTPDRVPHYPAPSRPSADFGNTRIVLVLAAAIVITLIMMFSLGGDGRIGVTSTANPVFKTPPPPSQATAPAEPAPEPSPKPSTEPTPKPAAEPTPDPTTEPTPNPTTEPRPTQAPIP